jgi:phosphoribosylanthranilate isomerase
MVRIKICGLTNLDDALAAIDLGADALGFILYEKSKRFIAIDQALAIVEKLPPFVTTVAVTVNATKEFSNLGWRKQLKHFNLAQLHGAETGVHARAVGKYLPVVKALPADHALQLAPDYPTASAFLLDSPSPEHGGTGRAFDWNLAVKFKSQTQKPLILSGGLTPENVARAIETVQPYAVDVASGVELSPGKKDRAKLRDFISICKRY